MKFIVFYLQFINSLEGLGMFFSSPALIRRLHKYNASVEIGFQGTRLKFGRYVCWIWYLLFPIFFQYTQRGVINLIDF